MSQKEQAPGTPVHPASVGDQRGLRHKRRLISFLETVRLATGACHSLTCMSSLTWALSTSRSMRCSSSNSASSLEGRDDF